MIEKSDPLLLRRSTVGRGPRMRPGSRRSRPTRTQSRHYVASRAHSAILTLERRRAKVAALTLRNGNRMPFTYEELTELLGTPTRERPLQIQRRGARGSLAQQPPIIVPRGELDFVCGCRAELGFGASYNLVGICSQHKRGIPKKT